MLRTIQSIGIYLGPHFKLNIPSAALITMSVHQTGPREFYEKNEPVEMIYHIFASDELKLNDSLKDIELCNAKTPWVWFCASVFLQLLNRSRHNPEKQWSTYELTFNFFDAKSSTKSEFKKLYHMTCILEASLDITESKTFIHLDFTDIQYHGLHLDTRNLHWGEPKYEFVDMTYFTDITKDALIAFLRSDDSKNIKKCITAQTKMFTSWKMGKYNTFKK